MELGEKIKMLEQEKSIAANELMKVRELCKSMELELETLRQRIQGLEERQHNIMMFLSFTMCHLSLMQFVQQSEGLVFSKKRQLLG